MAEDLQLHVEARTVGGAHSVIDLDRVFQSWSATNTLNNVGFFRGTLALSVEASLAVAKLEPWFTELHVTDTQGVTLWCGPVTYAFGEVRASEMTWWAGARVVRTQVTSAGTMSPQAFVAELFVSGITPNDPGLVAHFVVHPGGTGITKTVEAFDGYAWEQARSIIGSEVDVWCRGRAINFAPSGTCNGSLGVVSASTILGDYGVGRDGTTAATCAIVRGMPGVLAVAGGPSTMSDGSGVLVETFLKDERIASEMAAQRAAAVLPAPLAPLVLETATGATIDCSTGINPADLSPGVCVTIESPERLPVQARVTQVSWGYNEKRFSVGVAIEERSQL